ncbi:MAG: DUF502 domain-containing protein [Candidatus Nanohalobium sp.]
MSLKESFKDSFLSGLVLLTPLIATAVIISFLLGWTSGLTGLFIDYFDLSSLTFRLRVAAQVLVLLVMAGAVAVIGKFSRSRTGRKTLGGFGKIVNIVPVYRSLYHGIKHLANSLAENQSSYRKAVLAEYPSEDIYRIGFITSESSDEIEEAAGEKLVNVYLPNSPTPTAGVTAMMPRGKLHELDMSVKKAFKLLVTTGVSSEKMDEIMPEDQVS